ncbi:Long-chain-fatty-acid--CoA ligase [Carnimonas sp. R-84981]|uniref:class I adenylate-forming enzyme family protein n=1 Tax=Carnimonas bestiolae TaxID=3402172 RepID=UPI003EDC2BA4
MITRAEGHATFVPYEPPGLFSPVMATPAVGGGDAEEKHYQFYADHWQRQNIEPGRVVLIAMPNCPDLMYMFFAVLNSGFVPALIPPLTPTERILHMLEDFAAAALVRTPAQKGRWKELGISEAEPLGRWQVGTCRQGSPALTQPGQVVIATSGTSSSFSSGCVHHFDSLRRNALRHAKSIGMNANDRVLISLPMCYSTALVAQMIAALEIGCEIVISGPPFSIPHYLADLKRYGVTLSSLTPVLLRQLNNRETTLPPGLKKLTIGGDLAAPREVEDFLLRHPWIELNLTYGISEAGPRVSTCPTHLMGRAYYASVGRPIDQTEVRILPITDGQDGQGELLIYSDTLLIKRIGRGKRQTFVDLDGKRWLRTGDIFHQDADGFLFFKGRISDFIVVRDEKVNIGAVKQLCREIKGVLTCETQIVSNGDQIAGFDVILTCDDTVINESNSQQYSTSLLKKLKRHERPRDINFVYCDATFFAQYK